MMQVITMVVIISFISRTESACLVRTRDQLPRERQPLYLQEGTLALPVEFKGAAIISISRFRPLTVVCPGPGNSLEWGEGPKLLTCVGDTLQMAGKYVTPQEIQCEKTVKPSTLLTTKACGPPGSSIIEIGFQYEGWHRLFEVCFNRRTRVTHYARHKVLAIAQAGSDRNSERPAFKKSNSTLYPYFDIDEAYKKAIQAESISRLLGVNNYIDDKNFLSKGHLAADADYPLTNFQFATYFYVNTAPQWFSLNGGNWRRLEKVVRETASILKRDLVVVTGTHGILKLPNSSGALQEVWLGSKEEGIPVPWFFYKVVVDTGRREGIIFVMENNPFWHTPIPCQNMCSTLGFEFKDSLKKGTIYCCPLENFKNTLAFIPYMNFTRKLGIK